LDRRCSHLDQVFFHPEIVDDEVLPLGRVFPHEEGEALVAAVQEVARTFFCLAN